jgi:hypothetical protein
MKALIVYLLIGVLVAAACDWKQTNRTLGTRLTSLVLALSAWPLWGPIVWLHPAPGLPAGESQLVVRCRRALAEAREAVQGSPLDSLLPERLISQLLTGLNQVEGRHRELSQLLSRPEFQRRTEAPSGTEHDPRARPALRAYDDNVRRLRELRQRDERVLDEIAELAEALRTQLLVARYSGSGDPGASIGDLLTALATRVESMDAWFELDTSASRSALDNNTNAVDTPA